MAEHRQRKGRLGHEHVAGDRLEGRAGRVAAALVVARHDDALAGILQHDLGRAEDMAGRHEPERNVAQIDRFAITKRLRLSGGGLAVARPHDRQGLRRGEDLAVAGPGVIGMAMGDDGPVDRADRIDIEPGRRAPQTALGRFQPFFRSQPGHAAPGPRFGLVSALL